MSSPIGHGLIGVGAASVVASVVSQEQTKKFWIGAAVASTLPDLDWVPVLFGVPIYRTHRRATHALPVLGSLVALTALGWRFVHGNINSALAFGWGTALLLHPILDMVTTGSKAADHGFGIPLFWPFSYRRWALRQSVFDLPGLTNFRSVGRVRSGLLTEVGILGCVSAALVLLARLIRRTVA